MLVDDSAEAATVYTNLTGHHVDQGAVNFFRLAWDLGDLAAFLKVLRAPHRHTADTVHAYDCLAAYVAAMKR